MQKNKQEKIKKNLYHTDLVTTVSKYLQHKSKCQYEKKNLPYLLLLSI